MAGSSSNTELSEQFTLLISKLQDENLLVVDNFSASLNSPFIKVCKTTCDFGVFTHSYYIVLRQLDNVVKSQLLTYNEELLEEAQFPLLSGPDSVFNYVVGRMKTDILTVCPGVFQENVVNIDIDYKNTVIEKQGNLLFYRSLKCSRIFESLSKNQLCNQCEEWIKRGLEGGYSEVITGDEVHDDLENYSLHSEDEADTQDNDPIQEEDEKVKVEGDESKSERTSAPKKHNKKPNEIGCDTCGEKFKGNKGFVQHLKSCDHQSNFYQCDKCERLFSSDPQLKQHMAKHEKERKTHRCPVEKCNRMFKIHLGKAMRGHLESVHKIDPDRPPEDLKARLENVTNEVPRLCGKRLYPCTVAGCTYVGKDVTALRYHQPVHTGQTLYCCTECGKRFKYKKELFLCEKRHRGELNFFCGSCDKKFISKKKLDLHERVHTGEKPFICPICAFRSARKDNLNSHIKKHHGLTWREAEQQTGCSIYAAVLLEPQPPRVIIEPHQQQQPSASRSMMAANAKDHVLDVRSLVHQSGSELTYAAPAQLLQQ